MQALGWRGGVSRAALALTPGDFPLPAPAVTWLRRGFLGKLGSVRSPLSAGCGADGASWGRIPRERDRDRGRHGALLFSSLPKRAAGWKATSPAVARLPSPPLPGEGRWRGRIRAASRPGRSRWKTPRQEGLYPPGPLLLSSSGSSRGRSGAIGPCPPACRRCPLPTSAWDLN